MARAQSLNWEIEVKGKTVHPLTLGEFSEGIEGEIEVADGNEAYTIPDQILKTEAVDCAILIQDDKTYYKIMQAYANSKQPEDIYVIGRDSDEVAQLTFLFESTRCVFQNKSAFDRKGKAEETKNYKLIPKTITEIS